MSVVSSSSTEYMCTYTVVLFSVLCCSIITECVCTLSVELMSGKEGANLILSACAP